MIKLLTAGELGERLGVSRQWINHWADEGRIAIAAQSEKVRLFHPNTERPEKRLPGRRPRLVR